MVTYTPKHFDISKFDKSQIGNEFIISGWIRSCRIQNTILFFEISDGTCKTIQSICENPLLIDSLKTLTVGSALSVKGILAESPAKGQDIEFRIIEVLWKGPICEADTYLLSGKRIGLDKLRENPHLRAKTRIFSSIFRIRSSLSEAVHTFFKQKGFYHLNPNIITTSDCEGAGEIFRITNMNKQNPPIEFFGQPAFLTVSSQLQLELLCSGLGRVWTSNKSFRAEHSRSNRHLAEFEHIEWEFAWCDLEDLMNLSEEFTQYCFRWVLEKNKSDINELERFVSKGLEEKLNIFVSSSYARISYDEAIQYIEQYKNDICSKYELKEIPKWGDDLGSYCEKYLCEIIFKRPTFVYNYPRELKSFYMKINTDNRTVQACDLLIPGLGELIGSSIREENYEKIVDVMVKRCMNIDTLKWYLDIRKNGAFPHGGAGLGFDRLVSICTLMEGNIRDVVPFPVAYQECSM